MTQHCYCFFVAGKKRESCFCFACSSFCVCFGFFFCLLISCSVASSSSFANRLRQKSFFVDSSTSTPLTVPQKNFFFSSFFLFSLFWCLCGVTCEESVRAKTHRHSAARRTVEKSSLFSPPFFFSFSLCPVFFHVSGRTRSGVRSFLLFTMSHFFFFFFFFLFFSFSFSWCLNP